MSIDTGSTPLLRMPPGLAPTERQGYGGAPEWRRRSQLPDPSFESRHGSENRHVPTRFEVQKSAMVGISILGDSI
jgi:hypothetical protein